LGRLPKSRKARAIQRDIYARIKAEKIGLHQFYNTKTGRKVWFREKLTQLLDEGIKKIDPMELVAVLGVTVIIKHGVDFTQFMVKVGADLIPSILAFTRGITFPLAIQLFAGTADVKELPEGELLEWLLSFTFAYLVVHNFGFIMATGSNLSSVVGLAQGFLG